MSASERPSPGEQRMGVKALPPFDQAIIPSYRKAYEASGTQIADQCLNSRMAWNLVYDYRCLASEGLLSLISPGGPYCGPHFTHPLGHLDAAKLRRILAQILPIFQQEGWALRAMFVDEAALPLYEACCPEGLKITSNPAYSDYLYEAEALRSLKGRSYRSKRNHVNRFWRSYPHATIRPLLPSDKEAALHLSKDWSQERDIDPTDPEAGDLPAIAALFDAMPSLDVKGLAIDIAGSLRAFSMGSLNSHGVGFIHFEKADTSFEGLYTVINQAMAQGPMAEAIRLNREEDMGLPGIRKAKQSYKPLGWVLKYQIDFAEAALAQLAAPLGGTS